MAYITNTEQIKEIGNIKKVEDEKISVHMPSGRADVIDIIGVEKYNELSGRDDIDDDKILAGSGEAMMVLCYVMPAINVVSSGMGVTRSTGFQDSRVDNLGENELDSMVERYRRNAIKVLQRFVPPMTEEAPGNVMDTGILKMAAI